MYIVDTLFLCIFAIFILYFVVSLCFVSVHKVRSNYGKKKKSFGSPVKLVKCHLRLSGSHRMIILPDNVQGSDTLSLFKSRLKTFL